MMVTNIEGLAGFRKRNRRSCVIFYANFLCQSFSSLESYRVQLRGILCWKGNKIAQELLQRALVHCLVGYLLSEVID